MRSLIRGILRNDANELICKAEKIRETWNMNLWLPKLKDVAVQFSSVTQLCLILCNPTDCSIPGFPVHHQPPELTQAHVHWVSDAMQLSHPLSSPSPTFNLFQHQGLFQRVSSPHQVAKLLQFQLQHQFFDEYSGLIFLRMDWLDLLAVQGTLKSLLQNHRSKVSILWHSVFFMVQLSHLYMTPGKTIALTRWTFVGKVMSLLFNMLSRLIVAFLPWTSIFFMAAVTNCSDFEAQENKVCHYFHCFPIYLL